MVNGLSATYPNFTYTSFPDNIDTFNNFTDINLANLPLAQQYNQKYNSGDIAGAKAILEANPSLKNSYIGAETLNPIVDAVKALETFYMSDVQKYLMEIVVHKGEFSGATKYVKYNTVRYNNNNAYETYMCKDSNTPLGTLPTNTTYWIPLTIRGEKGDTGIGLIPYGSWQRGVTYPLNALVAYNNALWGAIKENTSVVPSMVTNDTWFLVIEFSSIFTTFPDYATHMQTETVKSLDSAAIRGVVKNFEVDGLTLVNSITNGAFSNGTTGWYSSSSTVSATNNILNIMGNGLHFVASGYQTLTGKIGDKFFVYAKVMVTNSNAQSIAIQLGDLSNYNDIVDSRNTPVPNQWYVLSGIYTSTVNNPKVAIKHFYTDKTAANEKIMQVDGNAGVFAINITALGIVNYTETQLLELIHSGYFEGLHGVENANVSIVGKNLFDKGTAVYGTYVNADSGEHTAYSGWRSDYIRVKPSTVYSIQGQNGGDSRAYYDSNKKFISGSWFTDQTFTTPSTAAYIKVTVGVIDALDTFQLEEGTIATAYEPHTSSTLFIYPTLKSLPNGVKDRVYYADGALWMEKNVEEYIFKPDVNWTYDTNYEVFCIPYAKFNSNFKTDGAWNRNISNFLGASVVFTPAGVDCLAFSLPKSILTSAGYATDSVGARNWAVAVGFQLFYQLAKPQLINLTEQGLTDGELFSVKGGTVYNISNTFHSPSISFDAPINLSAQLVSMIDSGNYLAKLITSKASAAYIDNKLNDKASTTYIDNKLGEKASTTYVDNKLNSIDNVLNNKASIDYVDNALNNKASTTYVNNQLNYKAPLDSPTFTGIPKAENNTSYTTPQFRNSYFSTTIPTSLANGEICFVYE